MSCPQGNPDASLLQLSALDMLPVYWRDLAHPENCAGSDAPPQPVTAGGLNARKSDRNICCRDRTSCKAVPVGSTSHS
jgi:hypothetical protein